jgi:putative addiction module component (TIGR02574 family)
MTSDLEISHLSPAECVLLAEELWDSARTHPKAVPVPPEHLAEIERRIEAMDAGAMAPNEAWDVVRTRLWKE